ncbi:hypothetical protein JNB85_07495 [Rhizobium mesosinicum]|uniref:Uncharacterized protein n=1 Tax=Rhizobium mesosinicum TaxID=335017 RepID=A0ABS7GQQ9_9HYPH|nr:hypothetical protein [Rhizobium mesosinicum]
MADTSWSEQIKAPQFASTQRPEKFLFATASVLTNRNVSLGGTMRNHLSQPNSHRQVSEARQMRSVLTPTLVSIAASLSLLLLSACSKDELADREDACADYVKFEVLKKGDIQRCIAEESFFRTAAEKIAGMGTDNIYPILLEDTKRMALSSDRLDKASFKLLPSEITNPDPLTDEQPAMKWHVALDLSNVMFDAPTQEGEFKRDWWELTGERSKVKDDLWNLKIIGIGPHDFAGLETICQLLAYSEIAPGCEARVYIDVDPDSTAGAPELAVMAVEFKAPPEEKVRQILLENEMLRWSPRT